MAMIPMSPAGWHTDPGDANYDRYWSGTEWSDQVRPHSKLPPPTLQPPSAVPLAGNRSGARKTRHTPALARMWHSVNGWPLEVVVDGLQAQDTAARVAAAARLVRVRPKPSASLLEAEIACLSDPVPAVRYHALRAMTSTGEHGKWLVELLISDREADAGIRASVLADLAGISGPESPFHGKKAAEALEFHATVPGSYNEATKTASYTIHNILHFAAQCARSAETALPILEAAARAGMAPAVIRPWRYYMTSDEYLEREHRRIEELMQRRVIVRDDDRRLIEWPDRCCVCGAAAPGGRAELPFSGWWKDVPPGLAGTTVTVTTTTVKGTVTPPVCAAGECHPPAPIVFTKGLGMNFLSPRFVAELLHIDRRRALQETWMIAGMPERLRTHADGDAA
jgi:hypothetical protein